MWHHLCSIFTKNVQREHHDEETDRQIQLEGYFAKQLPSRSNSVSFNDIKDTKKSEN